MLPRNPRMLYHHLSVLICPLRENNTIPILHLSRPPGQIPVTDVKTPVSFQKSLSKCRLVSGLPTPLKVPDFSNTCLDLHSPFKSLRLLPFTHTHILLSSHHQSNRTFLPLPLSTGYRVFETLGIITHS